MELEKGNSGIWKKRSVWSEVNFFPEKRVLTTASTKSIDFQLLVNLRTDSFHLPTSPVYLSDPLAPYFMSVLVFSFVLVFPAVCSFIFPHCGSPSDAALVFLYPADVVTHSSHHFGTTAS